MLSTFIYPSLGSRPIAEITAPELLAARRVIEARGTHETAHRTKQRVGQVFRYAIATGRAERDISVYFRGALAPVLTKNHAAIIDPISIGHLLRAIRPCPCESGRRFKNGCLKSGNLDGSDRHHYGR